VRVEAVERVERPPGTERAEETVKTDSKASEENTARTECLN
jgi:hypothetical protein